MSYKLNEKISGLTPYDPISGSYRIRLDANESFLNIPKEIIGEIFEAFSNNSFNRYPDPCCTELIKKYAGFFGLDPDSITMGNGSDELLSLIVSAFLMKGESMVTVLPDFSMYAFYAGVFENKVIPFQKNDDFTFDVHKLSEFVNKNEARLLMFSNPCNPTGWGIKREEVERLVASTNALVVVDEAYMDFWDESVKDLTDKYDNLIVLKTFSKAFGFAGARLGVAIANKTLTNVLRAVKSPYNVNSFTQISALCLLEHKDYIEGAIESVKQSVRELYSGLKEIEKEIPDKIFIAPTYTNFVVLRSKDAKELFDYLLFCSIAVRYMGGFLRITAGSADENREVIKCIKNFFKNQL